MGTLNALSKTIGVCIRTWNLRKHSANRLDRLDDKSLATPKHGWSVEDRLSDALHEPFDPKILLDRRNIRVPLGGPARTERKPWWP